MSSHAVSRSTLRLLLIALIALGALGFALPASAFGEAADNNTLLHDRVLVLKGYLESYALQHDLAYPDAGFLQPTGHMKRTYWPHNPWTGELMHVGAGLGDLSYSVSSDHKDFTLTGHGDGVQYSASSSAPDGVIVTHPLGVSGDDVVRANLQVLQAAIDRYALDNNDVYPAPSEVTRYGGVGTYLWDWPLNPWTGAAMVQNTDMGDFTYTTEWTDGVPAGDTLTGHLASGGDYALDDTWSQHFMLVRTHLKDMICKSDVQVLKEYVEEWKAANGGVPPQAAEMTAPGGVGSAHSWWPLNPFTMGDMTSDNQIGDFQYTPDPDDSYTLTVRLVPDAAHPLDYPQYWPAQ